MTALHEALRAWLDGHTRDLIRAAGIARPRRTHFTELRRAMEAIGWRHTPGLRVNGYERQGDDT